MDTATGSSDVVVPLHPVHKELHRVRVEVNITVKGQDKRVVRQLPLVASVMTQQQLVGQQVVHVHHLQESQRFRLCEDLNSLEAGGERNRQTDRQRQRETETETERERGRPHIILLPSMREAETEK